MAFDAYLKIDGVEGESTADGFENQIEIYSFSWGASNPVTIGPGTKGSGGGRVSLSSFNIMKKTDKTSPVLFMQCCQGKHYDSAVLSMRKAGGDQNVYLSYTFSQVYVDSIQWSGSSGGDDTPTESVSFTFAKVEISYCPQKTDGSLDSPIKGSWDQTTVKKA